ncbi:saccharopine dehydrogenase NADP-binding domain-containing protein [Aquabacterium sp.]|uniref:saccharopine dehydrogenase family protein n=1 Tax=Aquabacterium sp. TaxID=1872578 RepID=UPI002486FD2B|nr:saccharopine dehydrogenase NADP-binding domain-containing protein [Aquabacterium sp.]MDI1260205.1 saccharopine dehydrogenase NADP-binding domain-containing protein [Aquabacterium sp.]
MSQASNMPPYHLVVFGATSFVGQIVARYLWEKHGVGGSLNWALAGRSMDKLREVRAALGLGAQSLPILVADASRPAELTTLCQQTRVVVSTVGPYAIHGSALVKACAETGADYCDLAGEVQWISRMLDEHDGAAKASGARIVNCCGFDSVPSDLGVYFLQKHARSRLGQPCSTVKFRIKEMRGEFSGGTVASILNAMREAVKDPQVRGVLSNPYALCPGVQGVRQANVRGARYEKDIRSWVAPFVMAGINTRVVHRSNLLTGRYGVGFRYDEAMMVGPGIKGFAIAAGITLAMGGFMAMAMLSPTRHLLERWMPQPGEGPSPEVQEKGGFDIRLFGRTADGQSLGVKVTGDRDPGYGSTAKMLGEAALCLALETDRSQHAGGFWTPASLMGDRLLTRLQSDAGLTFDVL